MRKAAAPIFRIDSTMKKLLSTIAVGLIALTACCVVEADLALRGGTAGYYVEPNPVPNDPPRGYFNYDADDPSYGPDAWGSVDTSSGHFLREFDRRRNGGYGPWRGHLRDVDPTRNRCGGPDRKQSPKDLIATVPCEAIHEIRTKVRSAEEQDSIVPLLACSPNDESHHSVCAQLVLLA